MITLFTTAKPFRGHIEIIQRNAIASWMQLKPHPQIILFGNDEGSAEIASELGIQHVPDILWNSSGTPRLDGLLKAAQELSTEPILCYINADIILVSDFISSVERVISEQKSFLLIGQRWDVDITEPIEFSAGWENTLLHNIRQTGQLHGVTGMD